MISDPNNPKRSLGLPTTYQDMAAFPEQDGGLKGEAPASYPGPSGGMWQLDQVLQKRKEDDAHRQMLAQMLATPQQGAAPQPVPSRQVVHGPPVVQASPWSILGEGITAFTKAYRQGQGGGGAAPAATFTSSGGGLTG